MNSNEILNSVAMMSALYDTYDGDYYDLLISFVKNILPCEVDSEIDPNIISKLMFAEYGFKPPIAVVIKLLRRLSNNKYCIVRIDNRKYYMRTKIDNKTFENNRYKIREKNDKIVVEFTYFVDTVLGKKISKESADEQLRDFFERFGNNIYREENLDLLISRWDKKSNFIYYGIGRFISDERSKSSTIYRDIIEVVKGYLIYNALYFFFNDAKKDVKSKLNGVNFVFDTALILDILGYHEDGQVSIELMKLIKEYEGNIAVFNHSIIEIKNILYFYYYQGYEARELMQIVKYKNENYSNEQILRDISFIEDRIKRLGIKMLHPERINVSDGDEINSLGIIDQELLKENYLKYFKLNLPNDTGIEHDIKSIAYIGRLRKGDVSDNLENSKALFITKNYKLVFASQDLINSYQTEQGSRIINFAMKDTDITSVLWLNKYNNLNNIPEAILMEKVYAAINPTDEVLKKYFREINILERDQIISEEAAFTIRTSEKFKEQIVSESENIPEQITPDMIMRVYKTFEADIAEKYIEQTRKEGEETYRKNTDKMEANMANKASNFANNKMIFYKHFLSNIVFVISIIFSIASVYYLVNYGLGSIKGVAAVIILVPSIVQNIEFIFGKRRLTDRLLLRFLERIRVREFERKMKEYNAIIVNVEDY